MNLMVLAGLYHKYGSYFGEIFEKESSVKEYTVGLYLAFFGISYLAGLALSVQSSIRGIIRGYIITHP